MNVDVNVPKQDWNLFVPNTLSGGIPTKSIEGVVNSPPPPAIESINEAKKATINKIKYTVDSSYKYSISNYLSVSL